MSLTVLNPSFEALGRALPFASNVCALFAAGWLAPAAAGAVWIAFQQVHKQLNVSRTEHLPMGWEFRAAWWCL